MNLGLASLNAFIGMVSPPDTSWPNPLHQAGYSLAALELPLDAQGNRVVADAVAFNADTSDFIVVEVKGGKNINPQQAIRYSHVDPDRIVQDIGISVKSPQPLTVTPLYVCLQANESRIVMGLSQAGCSYPLLSVAEDSITLAAAGGPPHLKEVFADPILTGGWPSAAIHVDVQSSAAEFDRIAAQALVAGAGSTNSSEISVPTLAEQAMPFLPLYGKHYHSRLTKKFEQAMKRSCDRSAGKYEFRRSSAGRRDSTVRIIQDPSGADPRGRAQSYQALKRSYGGQDTDQAGFRQPTLFDQDRMGLIEELDELQADDPGSTTGGER